MFKKFLLSIAVLFINLIIKAQDISTSDTSFVIEKIEKKNKKINSNSSAYTPASSKVNKEKHPADHILIQLGADMWSTKPSSITTSGGRHFNIYFMNDKPFKTNPKFSVAYGAGLGTSNIYFDNMYVDIKQRDKVHFNNTTDSNWSKFKVTSMYFEIPVELRYNFNHLNPSKSWKLALGVKAGIFLKGYTKGKDVKNANGVSYFNQSYIQKEVNGKFFNGTRISLTGRVGYGNFTLNASYALTPTFVSSAAPELNTLSIGLCIGGL